MDGPEYISTSVPKAGVSASALVMFGAEPLLVDGSGGGWHRHFMMLSSIPGFYPLKCQ